MKTIFTLILIAAISSPIFAQHNHKSLHDPVELNGGAQWVANPETSEGIAMMVGHLKAYHENENPDIADIHKNLMADFNGIFANCTMEGEAHNQLHNYLLPLRDMLAELEACSEDCAHVVEHIEKHLKDYSTYFQAE